MQKCQLLLSTKLFQIMKLGDNTPNNLTLSLVNWKNFRQKMSQLESLSIALKDINDLMMLISRIFNLKKKL